MKVCTDACLFGAWVANRIAAKNEKREKILDIGTGTGLLSLMLAQKLISRIDAVETDGQAAMQAKENFESSLWKERLKVIHEDARKMDLSSKYDVIISNPPFYINDVKSKNEKRNIALHSQELSFEELLLVIKNLLKEKGLFAVLLPFSRTAAFINSAEKYYLYVQEQVLVKQTEKHDFFRSMLLFATIQTEVKKSAITIKKEAEYSPEFICLLKDYYLYL